jgi:uncharacterized protein (TIGR03437 family)
MCQAQSTYTYDSGGHLTRINYGAAGSVVYSYDAAGHLTGRTLAGAGISTITTVNTAGSPASAGIAQNAWIEIHGTSLVPSNTASSGVIWNNAPDFQQGRLPTQLGGVSVTVNGKSAYIYFFCSAATDPSCATDQINALTPLDSTLGSVPVVVTSSSAISKPYNATMNAVAPSFLLFSAQGYIAATHTNFNLIGPTTLYPGASTPAAPGETIVAYAVGFGLPATPISPGSSGQSGAVPSLPVCKIGGIASAVGFAGLISPGLYQLNITVPTNAATGDDSISCAYGGATTPAGDLLTVHP